MNPKSYPVNGTPAEQTAWIADDRAIDQAKVTAGAVAVDATKSIVRSPTVDECAAIFKALAQAITDTNARQKRENLASKQAVAQMQQAIEAVQQAVTDMRQVVTGFEVEYGGRRQMDAALLSRQSSLEASHAVVQIKLGALVNGDMESDPPQFTADCEKLEMAALAGEVSCEPLTRELAGAILQTIETLSGTPGQ